MRAPLPRAAVVKGEMKNDSPRKTNALKVEAPNGFRSANCPDVLAQRASWKCASCSWGISNSAAS